MSELFQLFIFFMNIVRFWIRLDNSNYFWGNINYEDPTDNRRNDEILSSFLSANELEVKLLLITIYFIHEGWCAVEEKNNNVIWFPSFFKKSHKNTFWSHKIPYIYKI